MFRTLRDTPLALGFLTWRFVPGEDALVLVVKGTYRLEHGGRATLADEPDPLNGDVVAGDDPLAGPCRYASDLVPFKPKADAMLVGKVHTPEGRALPQCSATFGVGRASAAVASLSLLVTGDRYWLLPPTGATSEPRPFTEMDLGYDRAFGGPGWAANPAGKGVLDPAAREAIGRPLPYVEDPRELVERPQDRPAPAGFGPLSPHWAHRMARWPRITPGWAEDRWPWPPETIDYGYFNAAQPALQIEGYLRGDESVACENLHPRHRRYQCELPRVRPRAFLLDRDGEKERFREVGLRLDTLWVDMAAEKLVLVWRGSLPVASASLDEVAFAYLASESLDEGRSPAELHRRRFEILRMEAEADKAPAAPAVNDNDAPAPAPTPPAPAIEKARVIPVERPLLPDATRARLAKRGAPESVLKALAGGDLAAAEAAVIVALGVTPAVFEGLVLRSQAQMREKLVAAGHDPSVLDPEPARGRAASKQARPAAAPDARGAWTRARVESCLAAGTSFAGEDLHGLDLSGLDLRGRNLAGCILRGASLEGARLDEATLSGANLSGVLAEGSSLRGARLDEADLTRAFMPGVVLSGADLGGALLDDAALEGAKLDGCKAAKAYLRRADLRGADLSKADLREAHLDGARLSGATLRGADLTGASAEGMIGDGVDLRGATLVRLDASEGSRLPRAKLQGCRAERSKWSGADLEGADLTRCDLRGADFSRADLADAKLAGADCFEADFTRAKLRRASLEGANLRAGRFEEADLRRAVLRGAILYQAQLWKAQIEGADLEGAFTAGTLLDSPVRGWAR